MKTRYQKSGCLSISSRSFLAACGKNTHCSPRPKLTYFHKASKFELYAPPTHRAPPKQKLQLRRYTVCYECRKLVRVNFHLCLPANSFCGCRHVNLIVWWGLGNRYYSATFPPHTYYQQLLRRHSTNNNKSINNNNKKK